MSARSKGRADGCGRAEALSDAALLVVGDDEFRGVAAALTVLAGIAASDAACCAALARRHRVQDHRGAVALLEGVEPGGQANGEGPATAARSQGQCVLRRHPRRGRRGAREGRIGHPVAGGRSRRRRSLTVVASGTGSSSSRSRRATLRRWSPDHQPRRLGNALARWASPLIPDPSCEVSSFGAEAPRIVELERHATFG